MKCDETCRTEVRGEPCTGWVEAGFPWHGCNLDPDHDRGRRRVEHQCRCGHRWDSLQCD